VISRHSVKVLDDDDDDDDRAVTINKGVERWVEFSWVG